MIALIDFDQKTKGADYCPKCSGDTKVLEKRYSPTMGVRRRRECLRCKHRHTTQELTAEEFNRLQSQIEQFEQLKQALKQAGFITTENQDEV